MMSRDVLASKTAYIGLHTEVRLSYRPTLVKVRHNQSSRLEPLRSVDHLFPSSTVNLHMMTFLGECLGGGNQD